MIRLLLAALLLAALPAAAQDYPPPRTVHLPAPEHWFGGLGLTDQDGHPVKLYEELMAGRIIVVNAFYATCKAACPTVMGTVKLLQDKAAIEGIDASFISITIDPRHDTPDSLKLYASSLALGSGWHLLSGDPETVRQALHRFGLDTDPDDPRDHLNILYIANLKTGVWKKAFSLMPPEQLAQLLTDIAAGAEQSQ